MNDLNEIKLQNLKAMREWAILHKKLNEIIDLDNKIRYLKIEIVQKRDKLNEK